MNTRTTLFLAVVALGILVYLVTTGLESPGTDEKNRRSEQVLLVDSGSISRLELVNAEGNLVLAKNDAGKWMIEKPVSFPADDNAISGLLSELEYSRRKATLKDDELADREKALNVFGLKPARIQLNLREKDKTYQLTLGNETARAGSVYALINDGKKDEVAIIDKGLEKLLSKGLNEWRSRKIFDFLTANVNLLALRKDGTEAEIIKEGNKWKISKPLMTGADENEVATFLANLASAQAAGFVADNAADIGAYGLSSPSLVLDIVRGENKDTLRVGSELPEEKGFYYAQLASRPTVLKINAQLYQLIAGMMERLRDRRLFVAGAKEEILKVKIQKGDLILDLEKKPSGWMWAGPEALPADDDKVKTFIEGLKAARAETFQPLTDELKKKSGLLKPAWSVTLAIRNEQGETEEKTLRFSPVKKNEVHVETPYRSAIPTIQESSQPLLPASPYEWYGKILKTPFVGEPDFLEWDKGDGKPLRLSKLPDGQWPVEFGSQTLDRNIFDQQLQLLSGLLLREWLPVTDKTIGLPYLRLTLGQGDIRRVIEFGKELEDGWRMARIQGDDLAFVMSNEAYLLLNVVPMKDSSAKSGDGTETP